MYINQQCREHAKKTDSVITKKSKASETSEMEFFVNLANG